MRMSRSLRGPSLYRQPPVSATWPPNAGAIDSSFLHSSIASCRDHLLLIVSSVVHVHHEAQLTQLLVHARFPRARLLARRLGLRELDVARHDLSVLLPHRIQVETVRHPRRAGRHELEAHAAARLDARHVLGLRAGAAYFRSAAHQSFRYR